MLTVHDDRRVFIFAHCVKTGLVRVEKPNGKLEITDRLPNGQLKLVPVDKTREVTALATPWPRPACLN